ncbi:MAG: AAA family ATPase [Sulfurovum sp.]|nr:AAA family ATPase [Sulfurovum sp.]
MNALGTAFLSEERRVVLIDELDKSDRDLPNDLLHIFEDQEFDIEELKRLQSKSVEGIKDMENKSHTITAGKVAVNKDFPIIIMTSNDEQEFSSAFLRRCICIELKMPDSDQEKIDILTKMVESHFPTEKGNSQIKMTIEKFVALNKASLRSNDQLLNAIYMVLKSTAKYDDFSTSVLSAIE